MVLTTLYGYRTAQPGRVVLITIDYPIDEVFTDSMILYLGFT